MSVPICCLIQIALVQFFCIKNCTPQKFDQHYTGVTFMPFVKRSMNRFTNRPPLSNYTEEESRVMLEVVAERFSRIATWKASYEDVPYINNFRSVHTAETAAEINIRRGKLSITVFQGLWLYDSLYGDTEFKLAIEFAEKANKIYPGTVEGILLSQFYISSNYKQAEQTRKYLHDLRNSSVSNLKLGAWMHCKNIFNDYGSETTNTTKILYDILQNSDFVLCVMMIKGDVRPFDLITKTLLDFRVKLRQHNANLEVMGLFHWTNLNYKKWENIEKQKLYWESIGQWARQNNFPIWFYEAFDNPWSDFSGWWRLSDNSKSDLREGYVENILENEAAVVQSAELMFNINTSFIVIIVIGTFLIIILVAVIVFLFTRRKKPQQISNEDVREFMEGMSDETLPQSDDHTIDIPGQKLPYDNTIEIDKNQLKIDSRKILGTGQFGRVYMAVIAHNEKENEQVALKVSKQKCSRTTLKELLSEIKVMIYIGDHPNIVTLKGVCTAELQTGIVYIATELCSLGSLKNHLRYHENVSSLNKTYTNVAPQAASAGNLYEETSVSISVQEMLQWSLEIACGMEYLGTKNVVHADLATRNVLLTREKTAKISDFGLSRRMYNYTNYVKSKTVPLPWRWMAIESLKYGEFSAKSDVWAYGVTLWEIFSFGEMPFSGLVWAPNFVKMLVDGIRLDSPTHAPPEIYALMIDCWQKKSDDRPDFSALRRAISDNIDKTNKSFQAIS